MVVLCVGGSGVGEAGTHTAMAAVSAQYTNVPCPGFSTLARAWEELTADRPMTVPSRATRAAGTAARAVLAA